MARTMSLDIDGVLFVPVAMCVLFIYKYLTGKHLPISVCVEPHICHFYFQAMELNVLGNIFCMYPETARQTSFGAARPPHCEAGRAFGECPGTSAVLRMTARNP